MKYIKPLTVSLLLHAIFFISPVSGGLRGADGSPKKDVAGNGSQSQNDAVTIKIIERSKTPSHKHQDCPDAYGGVGMLTDDFHKIITKVYKDYPAQRAGLKEGDVILTPIVFIRGNPGTYVNLVITRNGIMKGFKIKRELICAKND